MTTCTPPPAPLAAIVRQATALVSARVAPVGMPTICLDDTVPAGSGMSTPGVVSFAAADAAIYGRPPATWPPDRPVAVLHEVLHQIGMANGLTGAATEMYEEEGLAEAIAQDLRPVWLRSIRGRDAAVPIAYPPQVAAVRAASVAATGKAWSSPAAKAWRYSVIATPPAARPAI